MLFLAPVTLCVGPYTRMDILLSGIAGLLEGLRMLRASEFHKLPDTSGSDIPVSALHIFTSTFLLRIVPSYRCCSFIKVKMKHFFYAK